jgi:transposase
MDHPAAVIEKAQRLEQLLQRVEQGEPLEQVCAALELEVDAQRLAHLQAQYEAGGHTWEALIDGRYGHPIKAHSALREWLYARKREDEALTAPQLVEAVKEQFGVTLSAGHINYLLRKRELSRPPGRPRSRPSDKGAAAEDAPSQSLDNAGVFFPGSSQGRHGRPGGGSELPGDNPPAVSGGKPGDPDAGGGERA